ncbi:putative nuclease of restriction endonuclease-like (RecB) superfamily [Methanocalculus alkaliphilus]|uniref:PDDEXK nuclease domain-containing protein n=1 Tax=Methanocalculus alkaliphilus TaxID=768730 RepID=UPI00209DC8FA|nr:PDDEXK nuclease domain-containing protein [Methanocalculus alkaliphilus]MCP1715527.1 putative nuclease of restriction endonuclease-like (RecB) superfamily [Methanocalculus alkaliphilus]
MGLSDALPEDYPTFLAALKVRIRQAQTRAILSVNRELILLYWQIGREIMERQEQEGWGSKVIDRLSDDLRKEFPEVRGFSPRNLKYMRSFAEAWPDPEFVQEVLAQITWYHAITLLDKVKDQMAREWYIQRTIANGWSRNVLVHQIESGLIRREGRAVTNFSSALPAPQSDLARSVLKDPYIFDFLGIGEDAAERELERALIEHIRDFLLELGVGFAFIGNQYRLSIGGREFSIDLLFYHLKLRSYVVIELKIGEFIPEYAGKMNFYLSAVDDLLRHPDDSPSIGIILCKSQNRIIAEYALRDMEKPIGVAGYELTTHLPEDLRGRLPTVDELEEELGRREG